VARRAVVFGSNGLDSTGALCYAKRDAMRMAAALRHPRCGFEVLVPNDSSDPFEIERCIADVAQRGTDADTYLVFFSGHGFVESAALLLMLDQTDIKRPLTSFLHADSIIRSMRHCPARHKMLILDCCMQARCSPTAVSIAVSVKNWPRSLVARTKNGRHLSL
jgi:hypothetical protein